MFETHVNLVGRVASDIKFVHTGQGQSTPLATFRVVSTSRRFDRGQGAWVDGNTLWVTIVCWRGLAEHVSSSLQKGDPVVVYGTMRSRQWQKENRSGNDIEIVAQTVGHDMCMGTSMFKKAAPRRESVSSSTEEIIAKLAESVRDETEALAGAELVPSFASVGADADLRSVGVPVAASGALPSRTGEAALRPGTSLTQADAGEQAA